MICCSNKKKTHTKRNSTESQEWYKDLITFSFCCCESSEYLIVSLILGCHLITMYCEHTVRTNEKNARVANYIAYRWHYFSVPMNCWFDFWLYQTTRFECVAYVEFRKFNSLEYFAKPARVGNAVDLSGHLSIYNFKCFENKKTNEQIVSFSKIGKNLQMTIALCLCMQCTESGVVNFFITFCALRALGVACANAQCDCRVLLVLSHNPMSTLDTFT